MQIIQKLVFYKTLLKVVQKSSNVSMLHGLNKWQEISRMNEMQRKQLNIQSLINSHNKQAPSKQNEDHRHLLSKQLGRHITSQEPFYRFDKFF